MRQRLKTSQYLLCSMLITAAVLFMACERLFPSTETRETNEFKAIFSNLTYVDTIELSTAISTHKITPQTYRFIRNTQNQSWELHDKSAVFRVNQEQQKRLDTLFENGIHFDAVVCDPKQFSALNLSTDHQSPNKPTSRAIHKIQLSGYHPETTNNQPSQHLIILGKRSSIDGFGVPRVWIKPVGFQCAFRAYTHLFGLDEIFLPNPENWLNKRLFSDNIAKLKQLEIRRPDKKIPLILKKNTNNPDISQNWLLANSPYAKLETTSLNTLFALIGDFYIDGFEHDFDQKPLSSDNINDPPPEPIANIIGATLSYTINDHHVIITIVDKILVPSTSSLTAPPHPSANPVPKPTRENTTPKNNTDVDQPSAHKHKYQWEYLVDIQRNHKKLGRFRITSLRLQNLFPTPEDLLEKHPLKNLTSQNISKIEITADNETTTLLKDKKTQKWSISNGPPRYCSHNTTQLNHTKIISALQTLSQLTLLKLADQQLWENQRGKIDYLIQITTQNQHDDYIHVWHTRRNDPLRFIEINGPVRFITDYRNLDSILQPRCTTSNIKTKPQP